MLDSRYTIPKTSIGLCLQLIYFNGLQAYLVVEKILIFNGFPITFLNIQRVGFYVVYFISRYFNGLPLSGFHRVGPKYGQPGRKTTYVLTSWVSLDFLN